MAMLSFLTLLDFCWIELRWHCCLLDCERDSIRFTEYYQRAVYVKFLMCRAALFNLKILFSAK